MAISHAALSLCATLLLCGSIVLIFFIILSGLTPTSPLSNTYFLTADTSGISGARATSQWTYFYVCGPGNTDCTSPASPAMPFGHAWGDNPTGSNLPQALIGDHANGTTSTYYYYMWRFGWVLYLIAIFFQVMAFFTSFLSCIGRLGSAITGLVSVTALFFLTIAVALMTTTFVKARDAFLSIGRTAQVGTYAFGFSWGGWAALFLATVLYFMAARSRRRDQGGYGAGGSGGGWRRKRSRSTRSNRSIDIGGGRRVKDDYS